MKIIVPNQLNITNIAGDFSDSIEAGMDESSLPFILEMLSKNFYSNPIGSICREITSNCFDSHIEANVDEPVIIKIANDEEGEYIEFKDVGAGLSPDRIRSIYMKYFTSTKRDSNDQIGGFGLGSKTPLSYTDYFYITTIFNNIKYFYLFSKGEKLPTLDLLNEESTEEHNGTEIKIYIKESKDRYGYKSSDKQLFITALKTQLSYFDNVYFIGCNIDNDYKIYEEDLFKFRNKDQYSNEMHICFGKVSYPIDWEQIDEKPIKAAIGVKFDISELVVTPNREALRYTNEVKILVKERVQKVRQRLVEIYLSQQKSYTDYFEWYNAKDKRRHIIFGNDELLPDICYLVNFKDLDNEYQLEILNTLNFDSSILKDIFDKLYYKDFEINYCKIGKHKPYNSVSKLLVENKNRCIYSKDNNFTNIKSYFQSSGIIIQRSKFKNVIKSLLHESKFIKYSSIPKERKNNDDFNPLYFDLGLSIRLYKLIKYLYNQVEYKIRDYHIEITEQHKLEFKEWQNKTDYSLKRKIEGKICITGISENKSYDWKLQEIEDYKGIIIYGFIEDKKLLDKAITFCYLRPTFRSWRKKYDHLNIMEGCGYLNNKACRIIRIAKQNEKYFKNKTNMIHVKDLYGDNKLFRQLASSYKIEILLGQYLKNFSDHKTERFIDFIKKINEPISIVFKELYDYHAKFTSQEDIHYTRLIRKDLKEEIINIATQHNLFDLTMESKIKIIEDYFKDVEMLKHIDFNDETLPIILKYLKEHKKKINLEYYCKIVENGGGQLIIDFEPKEPVTKFHVLTKVA